MWIPQLIRCGIHMKSEITRDQAAPCARAPRRACARPSRPPQTTSSTALAMAPRGGTPPKPAVASPPITPPRGTPQKTDAASPARAVAEVRAENDRHAADVPGINGRNAETSCMYVRVGSRPVQDAPGAEDDETAGDHAAGQAAVGGAVLGGLAGAGERVRAARALLDRPLTSYYLIAGITTLLLCLGLVMVLSTASVADLSNGKSPYHDFEVQLGGHRGRRPGHVGGGPLASPGCSGRWRTRCSRWRRSGSS